MNIGPLMSNVHEASATWRLPQGAALRLPPTRRGRWLLATGGRLWATRSGAGPTRESDVVMQPGQRLCLPSGSEWVLEGWGDAAFVLLEPPPAVAPSAVAAPRVGAQCADDERTLPAAD